MPLTIDDIQAPTPDPAEIAREYADIHASLDRAGTPEGRLVAISAWDDLRRRIETWSSLVDLHFQQDTGNEEFRKAREYRDGIVPKLTELEVGVKRKLLEAPYRDELERTFGKQAFALWEADVMAFDPAIAPSLVAVSKLDASYGELMAAAQIEFQGRKHNMSSIVKFREDPDRGVRHAAETARWRWFADNRPALDRIYEEMVTLRHGMARTLGFENYVGLGYKRMKRVDYGQADVERFRAEVRAQVVPFAADLRRKQAAALGVDRLMFWDDAVHDPAGNPAPQGDHDWMIERAKEMFDGMGKDLGGFFRMMTEARLTDLKNRERKAPGGFCTGFPVYGVPYIFANFNGTKHDVEVFTHEMGHAYQGYRSRRQPLIDYLWPTLESCEIHSMGLEFLSWPHMEKFFGGDADRYRRLHLAGALLFIPYGVAVDHFQHLVYARPTASTAERHAMWQEMERMYLPWRDYGDLPHVVEGGFWQSQRHIYLSPFYYIDYTLAQTCALQLWIRSQTDPSGTLAAYEELCERGGEAPFQELVQGAGLVSPFEPGCLQEVVATARKALSR